MRDYTSPTRGGCAEGKPEAPLRSRLSRRPALLELDGGAGALELGLGLLGVLLGRLLENRLGRAVDEVLGLLETQAGEGPNLLDDLDLLVAGGGEDHVELVLLLLRGRGLATRGGAGGRPGDGHRGRSRDAEALLEVLQQLAELEDGHVGNGVEDLCLGGHRYCSSWVTVSVGVTVS